MPHPVFVRCTYNSVIQSDNGLDMFVFWEKKVAGHQFEQLTVVSKFDQHDPEVHEWRIGKGVETNLANQTTAVSEPEALVKRMKESSNMTLRIYPSEGSHIERTWHITGFRDAVKPLEERCASIPVLTPEASDPSIYSGPIVIAGVAKIPEGAVLTARVGDYESLPGVIVGERYQLVIEPDSSSLVGQPVEFFLDDHKSVSLDIFKSGGHKTDFELIFIGYPTPTPTSTPTR